MLPAVILAGGLGTRLRAVINDIPKPMAPVGGLPFLHYLFLYLKKHGLSEVVLSVGYKHQVIEEFFGNNYEGIKISYAIENEPMGTGGGIRQAMALLDDDAFVLNGDTFFDVPLAELMLFHRQCGADISLSLKRLKHFDRYGTVSAGNMHRVLQFREKQYCHDGLINGGVYVLSKSLFKKVETVSGSPLPEKFSFEKEILEKLLLPLHLHGLESSGYFIDIGIPEDYNKVQQDFRTMFI